MNARTDTFAFMVSANELVIWMLAQTRLPLWTVQMNLWYECSHRHVCLYGQYEWTCDMNACIDTFAFMVSTNELVIWMPAQTRLPLWSVRMNLWYERSHRHVSLYGQYEWTCDINARTDTFAFMVRTNELVIWMLAQTRLLLRTVWMYL